MERDGTDKVKEFVFEVITKRSQGGTLASL